MKKEQGDSKKKPWMVSGNTIKSMKPCMENERAENVDTQSMMHDIANNSMVPEVSTDGYHRRRISSHITRIAFHYNRIRKRS